MTGGLVQSLRILLPSANVAPIPAFDLNVEVLDHHLKVADFWLVSSQKLMESDEFEKSNQLQVIPFPELSFRAFHPDQVYAFSNGGLVQSPTGPYNSAIALWAWRHRLSVLETTSLFTSDIFEDLGYHDTWKRAVEELQRDFSAFPNLNFREFLDPLQRSGVFMHTFNHPGVAAIAQMARLLAHQINPSVDHSKMPIEPMLLDGLLAAATAWSVYPSIANSLGFTGSFHWKLQDHSVIGLEEFISQSFVMYEAQQLIEFRCQQVDQPLYDQVLSPHTSVQTS
jgi:hypothetical protein